MTNRPEIRRAGFTDIPELLRLAEAAHQQSWYSEISGLDAAALKQVLMHFISEQIGGATPSLVAVADREGRSEGLIVATCRPIYEVLTARVVTDLIWYVEPGGHGATGPRLLRTMHKWADTLPNVAIVRQSTSDAIANPERTGRLLKALGMRQAGAVYEREVKP